MCKLRLKFREVHPRDLSDLYFASFVDATYEKSDLFYKQLPTQCLFLKMMSFFRPSYRFVHALHLERHSIIFFQISVPPCTTFLVHSFLYVRMPYDAETVGCTRHDSRPPNSPIDSPKSSSQKSCRQSVPSKVISVFPLTKERSSDVVFESSPTNSDISLQNQDLIQTSMNRESLTTLNDNLESNQAEEFSKGIFSEILKRLDQLKVSEFSS